MLSASFSLAADQIKVNVVTEENYPIQYLKDDVAVGPASDLVREVLQSAELSYQISVLPWARAYQTALSEPKTLIYSLARTAEREQLFKWVGKVIKVEYNFVGLKSLPLPEGISLERVKEMRIGVIRDSARHQHLQRLGFENLYVFSKPARAVSLLRNKLIDLYLTNYDSFQLACLHLRENCQDIMQHHRIDGFSVDLFLVFSHSTSDELVTKVRNAYQDVVSSTTSH